MNLEATFETLRPSIVAFGSRLARGRDGEPPVFPPIVGTGFVVDERGIVATNRHVVEALMALPSNPKTGRPSGFAIVFSGVSPEDKGYALDASLVEIIRYEVLTEFVATGGDYFGEAVPDLAFAQLAVRELPAVQLAAEDWTLRIGMDVASAGFPLGEDPLVVHGVISQATPLLRRGIVSGLNPFPCPQPHGFTVDIMSQGGASGSPIFRVDRPEVVGILHAGFEGTNITFAVPAIFVREALRISLEQRPLQMGGIPTLAEHRRVSKRATGNFADDWSAV